MPKLIAFAALGAAIACVVATSAAARPPGVNAKIVTNATNLVTGEDQVYTVEPDGTDQRLVANNAEVGQWSPDGHRIALVPDFGDELLFNPDTGSSTDLGLPFTLYPDLALFCNAWSPDGDRLACESFGQTDPSLNGVYTLRSSDGGVTFKEVTSGLPGAGVLALGIEPATHRLYVWMTNGGLFRSVDGAANWTAADTAEALRRSGPTTGRGAIAFDPAHPGHIFLGTRSVIEVHDER